MQTIPRKFLKSYFVLILDSLVLNLLTGKIKMENKMKMKRKVSLMMMTMKMSMMEKKRTRTIAMMKTSIKKNQTKSPKEEEAEKEENDFCSKSQRFLINSVINPSKFPYDSREPFGVKSFPNRKWTSGRSH